MDVLEKIDKLRKEKGWSVNYLAMEAGLTQSTVNNLYTRRTEPKIPTLRALCDALGITLSDFFKEKLVFGHTKHGSSNLHFLGSSNSVKTNTRRRGKRKYLYR